MISGFSIQARAKENAAMTTGSRASSGSAGLNQRAPEEIVPRRFIAFLFDDLHLGVDEIMRLRPAAAAMLASSLESTDLAAALSWRIFLDNARWS